MKSSTHLMNLLRTLTVTIVYTLGACASINSGNVAPTYFIAFEALKDTIFGQPDNLITRELVEKIPYASAKLKIGKGPAGLVILESIENKQYTWVSADKIFVVVKNGRIIRTLGLSNNLTSFESPKQTFKELIEENNPILDYFIYCSYDTPLLIDLKIQVHLIKKGFQNITILGEVKRLILIEEEISNDYLGWQVKNQYWVDPKDFFVWKSVQHISPKLPEFIFEVTKKPSI